MPDCWARKLTETEDEIAEADAAVRMNLRKLGMLHREGLAVAEVAGKLVTDIKRLMNLRDDRDQHLQRDLDASDGPDLGEPD